MPYCHAPDQGGAVVLAEERGGHHSSVLRSNFHERLLLYLLHLRGGRSEKLTFYMFESLSALFSVLCLDQKKLKLIQKNLNLNSAPAIPLESEAPPWFAVLENILYFFFKLVELAEH